MSEYGFALDNEKRFNPGFGFDPPLPGGNDEVRLSAMTSNDLYACWSLDQRCFADGEAYDLSTFRALLTNPDSVALKIVDALGDMKAFLVGLIDRNPFQVHLGSGHIIAVGVAPDARRRGFGRRLMIEAEQKFGRAGVTILHLEVRVTNDPACRMYADLGYVVTERRTKYYAGGEDGYKMVKEVVPRH